jgi:NAD(P)-dependent dehydrogenase (short-subunit alcohol dehydrogenase family)
MYLERFRLTDRVALVTGGASGIGLCTAQALAEAGARVTIADLRADAISKAKAALRELGYSVDGVEMDVTNSERVTSVANDIARDLGRIDILINNAGIARSQTPAEDVSDEHWLNVLDVNLNGTFWCARAFGKHMLRQARARL